MAALAEVEIRQDEALFGGPPEGFLGKQQDLSAGDVYFDAILQAANLRGIG